MKTEKTGKQQIRHTSNTATAIRVGLVLLTGFFPFKPQAIPGDLPTAEQVFEHYVQATGGRSAYEKADNRITTSKIELPAAGISMTMTVFQTKPNKSYIVQESAAIGKTESGTDGVVAWQNSAMTGPQLKRATEKADLINAGTIDRFAYWQTAYQSSECIGVEEVGGQPCFVIAAIPTGNGSPQKLFFQKDSKLLVKVAVTVKSPMGSVRIESELSDYRMVDGISLPHRTLVRYVDMKQEFLLTVIDCEHNSEIPKDRFQVPPEIKALTTKR